LSRQRVKLVGKRYAIAARHVELAVANHVHEFDASQNHARRSKRLETEHWLGDAFDGTMNLLHDIVEILDLPDLDRDVPFYIQPVERSLVGAAFIHCHSVRDLVVLHRLVEEAPGRCISMARDLFRYC
jgi:hypothetical protein